jgi:hypothetical protein
MFYAPISHYAVPERRCQGDDGAEKQFDTSPSMQFLALL